nr:immunoglobulin heavy chain junction region [Mus musculus]
QSITVQPTIVTTGT